MIFLFDTNIVIHYFKEDAVMREVKSRFDPFAAGNETWLCVVTIGELRTLTLANKWGDKKRNALVKILSNFPIADINVEEVLNRYAKIEAYSQCRLPSIEPQPISPRNMGKNDIWIAAVASILGATLITTDKDFDHLDGVFIQLERIVHAPR